MTDCTKEIKHKARAKGLKENANNSRLKKMYTGKLFFLLNIMKMRKTEELQHD